MAEVIIDLRVQGQQQVDKLDTSLQKLDKTTQSTQTNMVDLAKKVAGVYAAFKSLEFVYNSTIKTGLEYNRALEQQQQSISILIAATSKNIDSLGNQITAQQKFTMASKESVEVMKELERINASLPTTLKETADIYKAILPSFRQLGTSQQDLIKITEKLAIVQNVSGIQTANFLASVDGLATGGVEAASDLGRFLEALGLSNKALKESKDVAKLVLDRFAEFKTLDNYATAVSNLEDEWTKLQGSLTKDIFVTQKESVKELTSLLHTLTTDADAINGIKDSINGFATGLINLTSGIAKSMTYAQYSIRATSLLLESFSKGSQIVAAEIQQYFTEAFFNINKSVTNMLGEDVATSLGFTALAKDNSVLLAANKVKFLKLELNETGDAYTQLTNNTFKTIESIDLVSDGLINVMNSTKDATTAIEENNKASTVASQKAKELTAEEQTALKEKQKALEETAKAYQDLASIGMSSYEKKVYDIQTQTQSWIEKGVLVNDALAKQKILLDELNQSQQSQTISEDLGYYERKVQLLDDEYAKQVELTNIAYARNVMEIQNSDNSIQRKEELIAKENELYNMTLERVGLDSKLSALDKTSEQYQKILSAQMEVLDVSNNWGNSLNGVSQNIANVAKSFSAMAIKNLALMKKEDLEKTEYEKKRLIAVKKYGQESEQVKKMEKEYTDKQRVNELDKISSVTEGFANLAGAISGLYEDGSEKAKEWVKVQRILATVSGLIAVAAAMANGDGYTAVARGLAVAATLVSYGWDSKGGSSSGGADKPSQYDIREQQIEDMYTPMTDRMDRQIQLLESIDKQGSASAVNVTGSKISFQKDYALAVNNILRGLPNDVRGYGLDFNNALAPIEAALGFNIADVIRIKKSGWDKSEKRIYTDINSLATGNNMIKLISAYFEDKDTNGAIAALFGGENALNQAANAIQATIGDYTNSIVESLDDLKSASEDFKESYDSITGSMYYENKKLEDAFKSVEALQGNMSIADYLKQNIEQIDQLANDFNEGAISTLLSQDPKDMAEQIKLLEKLQGQTGLVFENGAKDALDFLESINLVGEAMATSAENIKEFEDSFKSEQQKAKDLADSLGVGLATTYEQLQNLFNQLKSDTLGLTDADLELLDANKALIDSNKEVAKSISENLTDSINKLRGGLKVEGYSSLDAFNKSLSESKQYLIQNDYEKLQDSVSKTISLSSALSDTNNFTTAWEMASQQAIAANEFEAMNATLETEKDILDDIKTNTAITAAVLSTVSSNPQQLLQQIQSNETTNLPIVSNVSNSNNSSEQTKALIDMVQLLKSEIKSMTTILNAIAASNQDIADSVEL